MNPIADFVRMYKYKICWSKFNLERLDAAIRFFESIPESRFRISSWRSGGYDSETAEQHLHTCGTTACVGGWLSLSPEWRAVAGSSQRGWEEPKIRGMTAERSVATYFGCEKSAKLFADLMWIGRDSIYYPYKESPYDRVEMKHVIAAFKDVRRIVVAAKKKCGAKS